MGPTLNDKHLRLVKDGGIVKGWLPKRNDWKSPKYHC